MFHFVSHPPFLFFFFKVILFILMSEFTEGGKEEGNKSRNEGGRERETEINLPSPSSSSSLTTSLQKAICWNPCLVPLK